MPIEEEAWYKVFPLIVFLSPQSVFFLTCSSPLICAPSLAPQLGYTQFYTKLIPQCTCKLVRDSGKSSFLSKLKAALFLLDFASHTPLLLSTSTAAA